MCEVAANKKSWDAMEAEMRGDTKKAAECYAKAKKLAWMFPESEADHDTKLKRLSK